MAIPPQSGPTDSVPPPPDPDQCVECLLPGGMHIITTVLNCQASGGTPVGPSFPCDEAEARRKVLESQQQPKA
jgi:hypothetical protein